MTRAHVQVADVEVSRSFHGRSEEVHRDGQLMLLAKRAGGRRGRRASKVSTAAIRGLRDRERVDLPADRRVKNQPRARRFQMKLFRSEGTDGTIDRDPSLDV